MKFIIYTEEKHNYVLPVCESCLSGEHISHGSDHRTRSPSRNDCKTTDKTGKYQCICNPEWPELYRAIEKGIPEKDIFSEIGHADNEYARRRNLEKEVFE